MRLFNFIIHTENIFNTSAAHSLQGSTIEWSGKNTETNVAAAAVTLRDGQSYSQGGYNVVQHDNSIGNHPDSNGSLIFSASISAYPDGVHGSRTVDVAADVIVIANLKLEG